MKTKYDKKKLFNIYTLPALILTLINFIVIISDYSMITLITVIMNITFWITGILLYKKKNFSSIISIIPICISFIISIKSTNYWVDPYWIHGLLLLFFIISELVIFYRKKEVNKLIKKIVSVIILVVFLLSTCFAITDYILIKNEKMPMFMILLNSNEGEYIGLGYRFSLYNGASSETYITSNSEYYFGSWFYLFGVYENNINAVVDIIDKVEEENLVCQDAIEYFYEDRENTYYFSCIKKNSIIVEYEDGTSKKFMDAFLEDIFLDDLNRYNIEYIKEKKVSSIGQLSSTQIENFEIELLANNSDLYLDRIEDGYLDYTIKNNSSENTYSYGHPYFIEIKKNGLWYELVPPNELLFTMPLLFILPNEEKALEIDFKHAYGELEKGDYRLVKDFGINDDTDFYVALEFQVE